MKTVIIFSFVCSARDTRDTRDNGLLKKHQEDKDHKKHRIRARIFYLLSFVSEGFEGWYPFRNKRYEHVSFLGFTKKAC